jgi:hypothetical protein
MDPLAHIAALDCAEIYSDLPGEVDGAGVDGLSVLVAGPLSDPPLSDAAELLSELLFPS